jgi:hypothetical protein
MYWASPCWEAGSCPAREEIPCFVWNLKVYYSTWACHWILSWAGWIHSMPSIPLSVRFILMLSPHLQPCLVWSVPVQAIWWNCMHLSFIPCVLHVLPISSSIGHSDIWWRVQIMKPHINLFSLLLLLSLFQIFSVLYVNTLSLCFSFRLRWNFSPM